MAGLAHRLFGQEGMVAPIVQSYWFAWYAFDTGHPGVQNGEL